MYDFTIQQTAVELNKIVMSMIGGDLRRGHIGQNINKDFINVRLTHLH